MSSSKFVKQHLINLYALYTLNPKHKIYLPPLDRFMKSYFTNNKSIGSSERSAISQTMYSMIRYEYLLSYMTKSTPFKLLEGSQLENAKKQLIKQQLNGTDGNNKYSNKSNSNNDISSRFHFNSDSNKITKKEAKLIEQKIQLITNKEIYSVIDNEKLPKMFKELSLSLMKDTTIPEAHLREGKHLYDLGDQNQAFNICTLMNQRAPLTIRINPLKVAQYKFQKTIEKIEKEFKIQLSKTQYAPFGYKITSPKSVNLLQTESFKNGEFEIQDEGSQLTAMNVKCKPGDIVLDYCGGSGGKSLAIAHLLNNKGQIFVHEPRTVALQKAKKRFNRAGVQNVQFHSTEQSLQKIILRKADWIIIDSPCSGVGTLRRNPDIKLRFTQDHLKRLNLLQQEIFTKAMKYLRKDGRIVYITCSLLKQQNEHLIRKMVNMHKLEIENNAIMKILPQKDGMDGFFSVVLKRK